MTEVWTITWDRGTAEIQSLGGMLGPAWFDIESGDPVQPFFVAPWAGEPGAKELPGLLRSLRGEWPCVPFGVERGEPVDGWHNRATPIGDGAAHGHGANYDWSLLDRGVDWIEIGIDYPAPHPVRRLRRRIDGCGGAPALNIDLAVDVRHDINLGLALHPTFRLPSTPGAARVEVAAMRRGLSYPVALDASSCALPGQWFERLDQVPGRVGGTFDFTRLPFANANEDLLQLQVDTGRVRVTNADEGWAATVVFDRSLFPSVVLWLTNCGWSDFPWSGRTSALGIEPARAAFDLGQPVSADPENPLAQSGVPTSIHLSAGESLSTRYVISVEALT